MNNPLLNMRNRSKCCDVLNSTLIVFVHLSCFCACIPNIPLHAFNVSPQQKEVDALSISGSDIYNAMKTGTFKMAASESKAGGKTQLLTLR